MGDLPDVNVWLALAVKQHPHHIAAAAYWNDRGLQGEPSSIQGKLWFCRITMLGFVRLLTQPKVMADQALNLGQSLAAYQSFADLPEVGFQPEPAGCSIEFQRFLSVSLTPRLMTDAYLAAFAKSAGLRLVTFDKDFDRFDGLDCLRLRSASH